MVEIQKHVGLSETINENSFVFRDGMDVPCFIDAQKNVNCLVRDIHRISLILTLFRLGWRQRPVTSQKSRAGRYPGFT